MEKQKAEVIYWMECHNLWPVSTPESILRIRIHQLRERSVLMNKDSVMCNGEGNDTPLQYSCLENPMDRRAW